MDAAQFWCHTILTWYFLLLSCTFKKPVHTEQYIVVKQQRNATNSFDSCFTWERLNSAVLTARCTFEAHTNIEIHTQYLFYCFDCVTDTAMKASLIITAVTILVQGISSDEGNLKYDTIIWFVKKIFVYKNLILTHLNILVWLVFCARFLEQSYLALWS